MLDTSSAGAQVKETERDLINYPTWQRCLQISKQPFELQRGQQPQLPSLISLGNEHRSPKARAEDSQGSQTSTRLSPPWLDSGKMYIRCVFLYLK